jgi:hypothetical protein
VVPGANRAGVVDICINRSNLWRHFKVMKLTVNMRVQASGDPVLEAFDNWTLSLGDGTAETVGECLVEIEEDMCVEIRPNTDEEPEAEITSMKSFVDKVYPDIERNITDTKWLEGRAILAPTNKKVDELNDLIAKSMPGPAIPLYSSDTLDNAADMYRYNTEYLNSLSPTGLPRHQLILKAGMPLMILRNICPKSGLCNGSRLIFHRVLSNKLLECSISGGEYNNRTVLIPRINLRPKERSFPMEWKRRQFPVRTAFSMVRKLY